MKYEAGNRFNPDTYFKTEADSTSVTVKVTGELEGVEVSFDSDDVPEITTLSVTENGTYEAPEGTAYDPVTVAVPNTYTAEDAGKVVVEGALVSQTSTEKTANGTYDTTTNNEVVINVSGGGDQAFASFIDGSATNVVVPEGVTNIAEYKFYITGLTDLTLPSSLTRIEQHAIEGGIRPINLTVLATTPPTVHYNGIKQIGDQGNSKIYVPAASVETYKAAAGWSNYASKIFAIPTP